MEIIIKEKLLDELANAVMDTFDNDGEPITEPEAEQAVTFWLTSHLHSIALDPKWHVATAGRYGDTVGRVDVNPICRYTGWSKCFEDALPGSLYCEEHQAYVIEVDGPWEVEQYEIRNDNPTVVMDKLKEIMTIASEMTLSLDNVVWTMEVRSFLGLYNYVGESLYSLCDDALMMLHHDIRQAPDIETYKFEEGGDDDSQSS